MEENIDRINRAVHKAVLKKSLPKEIFDECERVIFNADVYRYGQRILYKLEKVRNAAQSVRLTSHWTYHLCNMTDARVIYPLASLVYVNPKCPTECGIDHVLINGSELSQQEMNSLLTKTDKAVAFRRDVFVDPGKDVKVEIKYRQVHAGDQSNEAICCIQPSMDMHVEVHVPNEDFIVRCVSLQPADEVQAHEHNGYSHFAWKLAKPGLPGQGMLLDWAPKSTNAR